MSKSSKVPAMRRDQPYSDWVKELQIWEGTNTILQVDKKVQAGVLFQSLEGLSRQTVLSELSVAEILAEDGVEKILFTLDRFFLGNEIQNSYNAIDELLRYKCNKGDTMENFIVQFQLKVNKVKASGTVLPEGVLGYALLNSANLPEDKHSMIKATCESLSFKNVKIQLEKVGLATSGSTSSRFSASQPDTTKVKVEKCFYSNPTDMYQESSSSDEDLNGDKIFYSKTSFQGSSGNNRQQHKINPTDRFGHIRACSYCKCVYHWIIDCPYAPLAVKNNIKTKGTQKESAKTL